jgi:hypothetical protein
MRIGFRRHYRWRLASEDRTGLGLRFLDSNLLAPDLTWVAAWWP